MSKKLITLLLIGALLFGLAGCGAPTASSEETPEIPQSTCAAYDLSEYGTVPSNALHDSMFVEKNGTVYYANPQDDGCLYAYNEQTGENVKMTDCSVRGLNADEQYIYYLNFPERQIRRIGQDGTGDAELYAAAGNTGLLLYRGTLYFLDDHRYLHTCSPTDGSDTLLLPVSVSNLFLYDGAVFFLDDEKYLCQLLEDGSYARRKNVPLTEFVINNGWVYFTDEEKYPGKLELDGTTGIYFIDVPCEQLTVTENGTLYFRDVETSKLHSYNVNGGDYTLISGDQCDHTALTGGRIFYTDPRLEGYIRVYTPGQSLPEDFPG